MTYKLLSPLCVAAAALGLSESAFAQTVAAPPAVDGISVFAPTADTAVWDSGTIEQCQLTGEPVPTWFGLWCYSSRHSMLAFNLAGHTNPVSSATFYLYDYYYEGFTSPGTGLNVTGTATVRGLGGVSFAEPAPGYRVSTTDTVLTASDTAWATVGTFTMTGSDGSPTTPGSEVGWYAVDVTSLWNANLGGSFVLAIRFATASGADGPIFEDTEGTAYANGCYGAISHSGPRIVIQSGPACISAVFVNSSSMVVGQTNAYVDINIPANDTSGGPVSVSLVSTNPAVAYPGAASSGTLTVTFPQNTPYSSTNVPITAAASGSALFYLTNATAPACIAAMAGGNIVSVTSPGTAQPQPWVFPGTHWDESKTPEDFGMIRAKLDAFRDSVDANHNGAGVVIKNGYLVYKWGSDTSVIDWASAAKPCIATMLFAALNEGKVASVDSLIVPYWSGLTGKDRTITFRHLADMTSAWRQAENPGTAWGYNDPAIMLYARTMDKVFGGTGGMVNGQATGTLDALVSAANQRLIIPLQFEQGSLFENSRGHVQASARDYARMGWFWVNRGYWNGAQLLPKSFFDNYMKADVPYQDSSCPRSATPNSSGTADYLNIGTYGGGVNNDYYVHGPYGFNWWFNKLNGSPTLAGYPPAPLGYPAVPEDAFLANGLDGQYCMAMIPSLGLVVAAWDGDSGCWGSQAPSFACNLGKITVKSGYTNAPDPNAAMNLSLQLLAQALPASPPAIPTLRGIVCTNEQFQFALVGSVGSNYTVQASTNLGGNSWSPVVTNASPFTLIDTNLSGVPRRFYRARSSL